MISGRKRSQTFSPTQLFSDLFKSELITFCPVSSITSTRTGYKFVQFLYFLCEVNLLCDITHRYFAILIIVMSEELEKGQQITKVQLKLFRFRLLIQASIQCFSHHLAFSIPERTHITFKFLVRPFPVIFLVISSLGLRYQIHCLGSQAFRA